MKGKHVKKTLKIVLKDWINADDASKSYIVVIKANSYII